MEILKYYGKIENNSILIKDENLEKFKDFEVEVIVNLIEKNKEKDKLMKFAGIISDIEADEMSRSIEECRNIDLEEWK